jgi:glycosyltransferase involved in cell wall biosynthesis
MHLSAMTIAVHIQFFIGQLQVGGIETYIVRIAKALHKAGHKVSVAIVKNRVDNDLLAMLSEVAAITIHGFTSRLTLLHIDPPAIADDVDLVFATGRTSLLYAAKASSKAARPVKLVTGVYSQFEFLPRHNDYRYKVCMHVLRQIGHRNLVFATEGCREDHARAVDSSWNDSRISPLLIDLAMAESDGQQSSGEVATPLRIVSVGRFVPFKTYNYYMPGVVRELLDRGLAVRWDVYGYGDCAGQLQQQITRYGVHDVSTVHPPVRYSELVSVFKTADIYIGSGTTLLEASAAGLPSIVALDDLIEPVSPGYSCHRSGTLTSDVSWKEPLYPVVDLIANFIAMPDVDRKQLSMASKSSVRRYSTENAADEYEAILKDSVAVTISMPRNFFVHDIANLVWRLLRHGSLPVEKNYK